MTDSVEQPSRLDRIEQLLSDTADLVSDTTDLVVKHDEVLTRIEATLETLAQRVATTDDRVVQILEYLFRERPNDRSGDSQPQS